MCNANRIKLDRCDYNEAQRGKDEADRVAAVMKRFISSFVDGDGNILNAEDIKRGILYKGGPKNVQVGVLELSKNTKVENIKAIKGISSIHSITFEDKNMKLFQYFNIGVGKVEKFNGVKLISASILTDPFTSGKTLQNSQLPCTSKSTPVFSSQTTEQHNQEHTQKEKHTNEEWENLSRWDSLKKYYANNVKLTLIESVPTLPESDILPHSYRIFLQPGYALPVRSHIRHTNEQKQFVLNFFIRGEQSGKKSTAEEIANAMKNSDQFSSEEFLTTKQIKALLSQFSSKQKKSGGLNFDHFLKNVEEVIEPCYDEEIFQSSEMNRLLDTVRNIVGTNNEKN